jgi:hypothetical protein
MCLSKTSNHSSGDIINIKSTVLVPFSVRSPAVQHLISISGVLIFFPFFFFFSLCGRQMETSLENIRYPAFCFHSCTRLGRASTYIYIHGEGLIGNGVHRCILAEFIDLEKKFGDSRDFGSGGGQELSYWLSFTPPPTQLHSKAEDAGWKGGDSGGDL